MVDGYSRTFLIFPVSSPRLSTNMLQFLALTQSLVPLIQSLLRQSHPYMFPPSPLYNMIRTTWDPSGGYYYQFSLVDQRPFESNLQWFMVGHRTQQARPTSSACPIRNAVIVQLASANICRILSEDAILWEMKLYSEWDLDEEKSWTKLGPYCSKKRDLRQAVHASERPSALGMGPSQFTGLLLSISLLTV